MGSVKNGTMNHRVLVECKKRCHKSKQEVCSLRNGNADAIIQKREARLGPPLFREAIPKFTSACSQIHNLNNAMAATTPQGGGRSHTNGVLSITASQTAGNGPRSAAVKPPFPKLKVVVRRLAPGLTEAEFTSILGDEWNVGQGKVDWFLYKPGKDSKEYVIHCTSRGC